MRKASSRAQKAVLEIPSPFDRVLASPPKSKGRQKAIFAQKALAEQAQQIRNLGRALGAKVVLAE